MFIIICVSWYMIWESSMYEVWMWSHLLFSFPRVPFWATGAICDSGDQCTAQYRPVYGGWRRNFQNRRPPNQGWAQHQHSEGSNFLSMMWILAQLYNPIFWQIFPFYTKKSKIFWQDLLIGTIKTTSMYLFLCFSCNELNLSLTT